MRVKLLAVLLLCLAVSAARAAAPDGPAIYADHCAACHDHPTGRIPPFYLLNRLYPDQVVRALTTGPMRQQAAGLTPDDISAIVFYLTHKQAGAADRDPRANLCKTPAGPINLAGSQWNGWGRDLENTRYQPDPGLAAQDVPRLKLKWVFAYPGSEATGQPTIVGDRLFAGSVTGRVFALDAKTGCTYWSFDAGAPVKAAITIGPAVMAPAAASSPAHDIAYFGDMDGFAYAVDAATGRLVWKIKADPHPLAQLRGSIKLYQGRLYVPISSGEENAGADPRYPCCTFRGGLIAVDAATGKIIWRTHSIAATPVRIGSNAAGAPMYGPSGGSIWNSPTIDVKRRLIYVGTGNAYSGAADPATDAVVAFDLDTGKRRWVSQGTGGDTFVVCMKAGTGNCPSEIGPDFDFGSSVVLRTAPDGKQLILAGQKSGVVYAFDPDHDGKIMWRDTLGVGGAFGGIEHGIAAEGDRVYVALSDVMVATDVLIPAAQLRPHPAGGMTALNLLTGARIWHTPAPDPVCSWGAESCFAAQAAAIAAIPGIVFSGSLDGHIRAYAAADGAIVWDFDTGRSFDAVNGGKANGGAVTGYGQTIAGGTLYVNSGGGYHGPPGNALLAFSVDGK